MRKKWIKAIIIVGALVLVCIVSFTQIKPQKLDADYISQIEFVSLPSPPKKKIITKKDDIKKIVSGMNSFNLSLRISLSHPAGTSVWINTSGRQTLSISMSGSIVQIDQLYFNCNEDAAKKMRELYQTLAYPEEKYP